MLMMVLVGVMGGERAWAVNDSDVRCFHLKYNAVVGTTTEALNPAVSAEVSKPKTEEVYTNRVCADDGKIYAEKSTEKIRFEVQGDNVCLRVDNEIKQCAKVESNGATHPLDGSLSTQMYKIGKTKIDNVPFQTGIGSSGGAETASSDGIANNIAGELTLSEEDLARYSGGSTYASSSNVDDCVALEYTYNGKKRYTNKLCVNGKGQLYSTTEGASEDNPTFVARESNWAAMNIKGNTEIGKTDWNGTMALNEFAGVVWANACKNGSACNGYELTGEYIVADEDSEKWNDADQTSTEDSEGENAVCYKGSGALGWIMCPIIQGVSGVGEYMWQQIEDNHLKLPANEIFKDDGGVEQAWQIVQGIANVAFVILFLVVIFSQITGKGIDNYGIKKILPKLIIAAVLMNLSYFICQLAVDLSNIIGNGINQMLSGLAGDIANAGGAAGNEVSDASELTSWLAVSGLAGGGVALFTLLNPVTALAAGASIGLAVLGLIITIVAAMLVLYLILVIREAGIVIMIVLAPVAIVCYMLPNTEKWFKRWLDIGKALLLVYPLCGLVVGGGQLAGAILGGINNSSMKIAGMIIQVLPFFLIPMLLRRSLSLMGNVGARVSNVGRNLGRRGSVRAQGAVQNSNRFKDWSQRQQEVGAYNRAQRTLRRLNGRTNLNANELDRRRKAEDIVLAQNKREAENADRQDGTYFEAMEHKQDLERQGERTAVDQYNNPLFREAKLQSMEDSARLQRVKERETLMARDYGNMGEQQLRQAWVNMVNGDNTNSEEFQALTSYYTSRFGAKAVNHMAEDMRGMDLVSGPSAANHRARMVDLQRVRSDNREFAGLLKSKTPDADEMVANAGMRYDRSMNNNQGGMRFTNMDYYTNNQGTATATKDWATVSTATLERSVGATKDNGDYVMSNRILEDILNSNDPAVQSGLKSEEGKWELIAGEYYNRLHNTNLDRADAARLYEQERRNAANTPTIRSSGAYRRRGGGVVQLNEMSNGTFVDAQSGQTVDIRHYTRE